MSFFAVTLLVLLLCFNVIMTIRIMPAYINHYHLKSNLKNLAQEYKEQELRHYLAFKGELVKRIDRQFDTDYFKGVEGKEVNVHTDGKKIILSIRYATKQKLFANIDTLVYFDDKIEINYE